MTTLGIEVDDELRRRAYQAGLLAIGGLLFAVANLVAGWLVALFAATLPLPPQTRTAVTTLLFIGLVYGVALHTEPDDDETLLGKVLGRSA